MSRLVRAQLLGLVRTRATWGFVLAALTFVAVRVGMVLGSAGQVGAPDAGSRQLTLAVLGAGGSGALLVMLLGAVLVTREFHHGSLTALLLVAPARGRVLAAQVLAAAVAGLVLGAVMFGLAAALGTAAGAPPPMDPAAVRLLLGGLLGTACWGWFGAALGALVRHQAVALLVPVLWFAVVELLLTPYGLGALVPWTPGGAAASVAGAPGLLPAWLALLVLAAYGTALTVPAARRLARLDVV